MYSGLCCKMFHNMSFSVMEMIMSPMLRQNWSKEWWTVSPKILWTMSWRGIDAGTKSLSVSVWLIRFDIVYLKILLIFKFQHPIYTYPCSDYDFLNFCWIIQHTLLGKTSLISNFCYKVMYNGDLFSLSKLMIDN